MNITKDIPWYIKLYGINILFHTVIGIYETTKWLPCNKRGDFIQTTSFITNGAISGFTSGLLFGIPTIRFNYDIIRGYRPWIPYWQYQTPPYRPVIPRAGPTYDPNVNLVDLFLDQNKDTENQNNDNINE